MIRMGTRVLALPIVARQHPCTHTDHFGTRSFERVAEFLASLQDFGNEVLNGSPPHSVAMRRDVVNSGCRKWEPTFESSDGMSPMGSAPSVVPMISA